MFNFCIVIVIVPRKKNNDFDNKTHLWTCVTLKKRQIHFRFNFWSKILISFKHRIASSTQTSSLGFALMKSGADVQISETILYFHCAKIAILQTLFEIYFVVGCSRIINFTGRHFSSFLKLHNAWGTDPFKSESKRRCSLDRWVDIKL